MSWGDSIPNPFEESTKQLIAKRDAEIERLRKRIAELEAKKSKPVETPCEPGCYCMGCN